MMLYDLSFIQSSAIAAVRIIDLLFLPVFEPRSHNTVLLPLLRCLFNVFGIC